VSVEPLNTAPIQQFIQQTRAADNSRAKEVKLSIDQAKTLAYTLGMVMTRLEGDLEKLVAESRSGSADTIEIKLDGSSF
jgi:hypothetical protein